MSKDCPQELHIPYSQLKPLVPAFDSVREAARKHTMNEYGGMENKDAEGGRRRTRAQYLNYGSKYGPEKLINLLDRH